LRAVRMMGNKQVQVVDVPKPEADGTQVVVRVRASAICGSDLHSLYESPNPIPYTPGHEFAGEVVEVDQATRVKPGDRVALYAIVGCGACPSCLRGYPPHCTGGITCLGFGLAGGDAEYALVPQEQCLLLPDSVSFDVGTLLGDIVGLPFHTLTRLGCKPTDNVAIFGLGPIGLGHLAMAKFFGARVIAFEVNAFRRDLGARLGADLVLNPADADPMAQVQEFTGGIPTTAGWALDCVRVFGKVALIAEHNEAPLKPSPHLNRKEAWVTGGCYFMPFEYPDLLRALERGLPAENIITHRFPLEQAQEAFDAFAGGDTGKVVLVP
jgi:threonine dehydrogenase-like Zn-dependent dehydrogenase